MAINRKLTRPSISLRWRKRDVILEGIGVVLLILYWGLLFQIYASSPESIPSHFDRHGNVDHYANKSFIWTVPKRATALYGLMTLLAFFPRYFNYGVVEITEENAEEKYRSASTFVRYLKLIVLIIFMGISLMTVY